MIMAFLVGFSLLNLGKRLNLTTARQARCFLGDLVSRFRIRHPTDRPGQVSFWGKRNVLRERLAYMLEEVTP
jgi:hypothetical protein